MIPEFDFATSTGWLDGASVLVTGGTGSFGRTIVQNLVSKCKLRRLVVYSRDELKQYELQAAFPKTKFPFMRFFIGDVRDAARLEAAMYDIDYVIHAAAMKHVPIAEYNPMECVRTNIGGAENVVQASIRAGVKRVVALSTDKAAAPINLYGATKLASDKIFSAANATAGGKCLFSVVRYGNVLGSRGSVLPYFKRLIAEGATSLPITDERMTRFWITIDQGVNFVLSSMEIMRGGELFVPKIASSRVTELVEALAPGMATHVIGIRPGEKLHETMITEDDARQTLELPDRYVIEPIHENWRTGHYESHGAKRVAADFHYASNNNAMACDANTLAEILRGALR